MFQSDSIFMLLFLIPVTIVGLVTGVIIHLIIKTDKESLVKKKACAEAGAAENISHENINQAMDSIQVSISKLRDTIERVKNQTDAINSLALDLGGRSAGNELKTIRYPRTLNSLGGKVSRESSPPEPARIISFRYCTDAKETPFGRIELSDDFKDSLQDPLQANDSPLLPKLFPPHESHRKHGFRPHR